MATEADVRERVAETFKEEKDREMLTEASNVVVEKSEGIAEPLPKFEVQVTKGAIEVNGKNTEGEFIYESPLVTKVADEQILSPSELNEDAVVLNETESKFLESSVGKESEKNRDEIISTINENSTEEIQHISKETSSGSSQIAEGKFFEPDLAEEMKVLKPASSKEDVGEVTISEEGLGHTISKESENVNTEPEEMKSRGDMKDEDSNNETILSDATGKANVPSDQKEEATEICQNGNRNLDVSSTLTPVEETCITDAGSDNTYSEALGSSDALKNEHIVEAEASIDESLSSSTVALENVMLKTEAKLDSEVDLASTEASDRSKVADEVQTEVEEPGKFKNDENFPHSETIQINPEEPLYATPDKIDVSESCQSTETTTTVVNLPEALKEATNDETLDAHYIPEKQTEDISTDDLKEKDDETKQERVFEENQVHITEPTDVRDAHEANSIPECSTIVQTLAEGESGAGLTSTSEINAEKLETDPKPNFTEELQINAENNTEAGLQQHGKASEEQNHEAPNAIENTIHESETTFDASTVSITEETGLKKDEPSTPKLRFESLNEVQDESAIAAKDKECEAEETSEVQPGQYVHEIPFSDSQSIENDKSIETGAETTLTNDHSLSLQTSNKDVDNVSKEYSEASHVESEKEEKIIEPATELHYSEVSYEIEESGAKGESIEAAVPESGVEKIPNKETNEANGATENYISSEKNISTVDLNDDENGDISCNAAKDLQSTLPPVEETKHEQVDEENQVLIEELKHDAREANSIPESSTFGQTCAEEASEMVLTSTREMDADEIESESKLHFTEKLQIDAENNTEEKLQQPGEAFEEHDHETLNAIENTPELRSKSVEEIQDESGVEAKEKESEAEETSKVQLERSVPEIQVSECQSVGNDKSVENGAEKSFTDEQSLISESAKKDVEDLAISNSTENEVLPEEAGKEYTEASHAESEHLEKILDRSTPVLYSDYEAEESGIKDESLEATTTEIAAEKLRNEETNEAKVTTESYINTEDQLQQHGEACEEQDHETLDAVENTTHQNETTSYAPSVTISEEAGLEGASLKKEESSISELPFKSFEEIEDGNGTEVKAREYEAEETYEVQPPQDVHETQFSDSQSVGNDESVETEEEKTLTDDKCLSAESSKKNDDELTIPYPTEKEILPEEVRKESDEAPHAESVTQVHYSEEPSELKESEMKEESVEAATTEKAITEEELPSITTHVISETTKSDDQCEVSTDQESEASKNIHKQITDEDGLVKGLHEGSTADSMLNRSLGEEETEREYTDEAPKELIPERDFDGLDRGDTKTDVKCSDEEVLSSEVVSLHPDKDIEVNDQEYSFEEKSQAHNTNISDSSVVDIPGPEGLENAVSEADHEPLLHKSTNESEISEISNKEVAITADDNSSESLIDHEKPDTTPVETACEEKEATEKSLPTVKADDKELEADEAKDEEEESEVQKGEYSASEVTPMVERDLVDVTSDKIITGVEIKEDSFNVVPDEKNPEQGDPKESTETVISSEDKHIQSDSMPGTVGLEIDEAIPVDSSEAARSNINEESKESIEDQTPDSFELAKSIKNEEAVEKIEDQATEIFEAARNDNNEEVTEHNEDQATVVAASDSETKWDKSDSPSSITGEDPKIHDRDVKLENLSPPDQSNTDVCQIDEHLDLATPTEIAPDSIELQNVSLATKEKGILEEPQTIESTEVTTISTGKDVDLLQKDSEAAVILDEIQKPKTENDHDAASEIATVESEAKDASDEFKEMEQESSIKQATDSEPDLTQGSIGTNLSVADERETLDQLPEDHVSEHVPLVEKDSSERIEPVISSEEKDTLLVEPVPVTGTVTHEIEEITHANASETEAKAEAENVECGEEQKTIHDYNLIPESSQSTDSTESAPSNLLHGSADVTTQKVDDIVSETLPSSHLLPSHDQKEPEADPKVTTEIVQAGGEISKCVEQSFEETKSEEEERTKDEMNEVTVKSLPAEETNTAAPEEETLEIIEHPSERIEQIVKNDELQTENAESDDDKKLKSDEAKDEEEEGKVQREEKSCSEVPLVAERDLIDGTSSKVIVELETKEDSSSAVLDGKISKQVDTEESIETVISSEDKHIQSDSGAGTVGLEIDESKHADSSETAGSNKSEEAKENYEGQAIDSSDAAEINANEGPKENNEDQVPVEARGSETKQNEDDTQSNITEGDDLKIHVPDVKLENLSPPEQSSTNVCEIDEPLVLAKPTEIAPDTTELDKISLSPKENENPEEPPSSECADVTIASRDIDVQPLQNDVPDAASEAAGIEPEATGTTDESKETEHESTAIEITKNSEADVVQGSENLTLSVGEEKETLAQPVEDNVYLGVQDQTGTIQKEEQVNLSSDESIREEVNESRSFEVPANKIQAQKDPEESPEPVLCSGDKDIPRSEEAKGEEVPKVADEINEPATKIVDNSATFEEEILVVPENAERFEVKDVKTDEEGEVQRGENSGFEVPLVSGKDSVDLTNNKIITSEVKEDNSIVVPEKTIPTQGEPEENTETLISREVPFMVTRAVNLENEELKHVNASEPAAETKSLECEEDTRATRDYNEFSESSKSMEPSKNSTYENPQASAKVTPEEAEVTESEDPESLHVPAHSESSSIENSTKDGASDINITRDKQEPEASPFLASSEHIVLEADQKVTPEPENSECVAQVQQEANSESYQKEPEPANIEEEKKEATEKSLPTETTTSSITTLSEKADHVNEAIKVVPEKEELQVKIAETDEKEEGENSGSDAPVIVEASRDIETKVSPKKSNNILSGVGSKVKHSIAKVKKAITGSGKHSHSKESKPTSPK